jgi:outer membrane protein assembly factor BamB
VTFNFIDKELYHITSNPVLITGKESLNFSNRQLVEYITDNEGTFIFEIRYEYSCGPFREILSLDNLLLIGCQQNFYIVNLERNETILNLKVEGYFGSIYIDNEIIYVADACGVYSINRDGEIIWHNDNLGIDGVVIHDFQGNKILGSGEFDPPGGWVPFVLDKRTGEITK